MIKLQVCNCRILYKTKKQSYELYKVNKVKAKKGLCIPKANKAKVYYHSYKRHAADIF